MKTRGQFNFVWIFGVAREIRLADQDCFAILDKKSFGSKFRNFQFNLTCSTGGFGT
jgi:hypothetical protein